MTQANIGATICKTGWTATVRPPVAYTDGLKRRQMVAYADTGPLSAFEEDHRVPLEVGGNPTAPSNLWPEARTAKLGAPAKDVVENTVRQQVCAGRLTLAQGQAVFLGDYFAWAAKATP